VRGQADKPKNMAPSCPFLQHNGNSNAYSSASKTWPLPSMDSAGSAE